MRNEKIRSTLPSRVRELRKERGWTMDELSKRIGLYPSAIHYIEVGERLPGLAVFVALADAFGISLDELLGRSGRIEGETG